MHGELPQFKRCCFCIPLRRGLIGYGYLKVALSILNGAYLIWIITLLYFLFGTEILLLLLFLGVILLDLGFSILLIVAGHMKSPKLMRVSYICGIVWLCIEMIFGTGIIWVSVQRLIHYWDFEDMLPHARLVVDLIIGCVLAFTTMFVQAYVILLTRSEMIKLQNQSLEMQFTNHAAEDGEARCVRAEKQDDIPNEITITEA